MLFSNLFVKNVVQDLTSAGHEWMRAKWSAPIRKYWKVSEQMMVKYCDLAICDSVNIEKYIHECYDGKGINGRNPKTTFIAYGADLTLSKLADDNEKLVNWYKEKGLTKKDYYLVVGRFVPENSFEVMIREFMKSKSKKNFAIITNAAPLTEKDTLDGIYERFNIQRPADFTGHSLSVSDVVALNDGSTVKAYYVDSIGFAELPEFYKEKNMDLQRETLLNEELQEIEIFDKPGLFSNGRLRDEDVPDGSTSNADRRICDFYDSAGGWQRGCVFGTGGSNDSASMVHIRR